MWKNNDPYLRHVSDVFSSRRFDRYVARVELTSADYAAQQCRFAASAGSQKSIAEKNYNNNIRMVKHLYHVLR